VRSIILFSLAVSVPASLAAAPVTFFGEDLHNDDDTRIPAHPNADAARIAFLSNLVGVGTETFELIADGTGAPLVLVFPGAGNATLTGSGEVESVPVGTDGNGRYPISGSNFWNAVAGGDDFVIEFSAPIAAFGFYGVDIGDFGGALELELGLSGGGTVNLPVGNTVGSGASTDGSVLYFGFYDTTATYTSIGFNNPEIEDFFAFDDMTVGSLEQVRPGTPIPEPASMLLLAAGLGAGVRQLRKRRQ
jgi:hypothetical protein